MGTAARGAGALCGALVGSCSALLTAAAHTSVTGALPSGSAAAMVLLLSAAVGAASTTAVTSCAESQGGQLITALAGGQVLGHLALCISHGGHDLVPSAPMLAAHTAAAVALGLLISLVLQLYVVCVSVLCWLSLVVVHRGRPSDPPIRGARSVVPQRPALLVAGLGMRAPPRVSCAAG